MKSSLRTGIVFSKAIFTSNHVVNPVLKTRQEAFSKAKSLAFRAKNNNGKNVEGSMPKEMLVFDETVQVQKPVTSFVINEKTNKVFFMTNFDRNHVSDSVLKTNNTVRVSALYRIKASNSEAKETTPVGAQLASNSEATQDAQLASNGEAIQDAQLASNSEANRFHMKPDTGSVSVHKGTNKFF